MAKLKKVVRYQCQFCKKDFKTPDRHRCKFNPELKNCFTCKHLKGWIQSDYNEYGWGIDSGQNYPDCTKGYDDGSWDIESIKGVNYNMQCSEWEKGEYD